MSSALRLLTVVGARPQFVKVAMVSRAIARLNATGTHCRLADTIVHTGQHYDESMSNAFFSDLQIPAPAVNLEVGSGSHASTTARMLIGLEAEIGRRRPDVVVVYGDTNSTLAGALAAAKLNVPIAHVESGLRSFNRRMPEEINRIMTDHLATTLFAPTTAAVDHLRREGIERGVHHVGDVMYDAALMFAGVAERTSDILRRLGLVPRGYLLATVHRAENTDAPGRLRAIFKALSDLALHETVVVPLHPRTRARLDGGTACGQGPQPARLHIIDPVPFLDMVMLERHARVILTDSGGVQKEAYFHRVPCVTLRDETEWSETVAAGWNTLAGADTARIVGAVGRAGLGRTIRDYGTGSSADEIAALLAGGRRGESSS